MTAAWPSSAAPVARASHRGSCTRYGKESSTKTLQQRTCPIATIVATMQRRLVATRWLQIDSTERPLLLPLTDRADAACFAAARRSYVSESDATQSRDGEYLLPIRDTRNGGPERCCRASPRCPHSLDGLLAAPSVPSRHRRPDLFTGFLPRINPGMEHAISAKRAASRRPRLTLERSVWLTIATPVNVRRGRAKGDGGASDARMCDHFGPKFHTRVKHRM